MSTGTDKPRLLLVRRVGDGVGGAAKTLRRFEQLFAGEWRVETLCAGGLGGRVAGARGPSWWRNLRFAATANAALKDTDADLVFTLERGVRADVYRTADGVHRRWLELSGAGFFQKLANPLHWIVPGLERETMRAARRIIGMGRMIAGDVAGEYPDCGDKIRIIPIGVDTARFHPHPKSREAARREAGLNPQKPFALFVGSGWKIKGLARALRLFASATREVPAWNDARLLIVGQGKPARYTGLVHELGLENRVVFSGTVKDTAPLCRAADFLLIPSLYETFANAALEAVACGCPLVTTDTVGAAELVTSDDIGLVLPGDFDSAPEKLADASKRLSTWLAHTRAEPAVVAAAAAGRTAENEKRLYLELFAEILAEKRATR